MEKRHGGLVQTDAAAWKNDGAGKDFSENLPPQDLLFLVEVLTHLLKIKLTIGDMHLNPLL